MTGLEFSGFINLILNVCVTCFGVVSSVLTAGSASAWFLGAFVFSCIMRFIVVPFFEHGVALPELDDTVSEDKTKPETGLRVVPQSSSSSVERESLNSSTGIDSGKSLM